MSARCSRAQHGVDRLTRRRIQAVFDASAIEQRHTVLTDLATPPGSARGRGSRLRRCGGATALAPSTGTRNDLYIATAPALFAEAAREALRDGRIEPSAVTHVVTVSCTGLFAPGPDYRLVRDLGLSRPSSATTSDSSGCAAALPGLRVATALAATQPDAVVLVVCTELCTLHVRSSADPQQIVAASVFADGAAAAIVTADPAIGRAGGLDLERFGTALTDEGETDMVWTIGDEGFDMVLSAEVPRIIGREIQGAVARSWRRRRAGASGPCTRAGAACSTASRPGWSSTPTRSAASRGVLRDFGNMSSATILFILATLLRDDAVGDGARVAALAFGPGLTVESALLTKRRVAEAVDATTSPSPWRHPRDAGEWPPSLSASTRAGCAPRSGRRTRPAEPGRGRMTLAVRDDDVAELMDDPECDPDRLAATLRRFGTVNRLVSGWGAVYRRTLAPPPRVARAPRTRARPRLGRRRPRGAAGRGCPARRARRGSGPASTPTRARTRWRSSAAGPT